MGDAYLSELESESIEIIREVAATAAQAGDAVLDRQGLIGDAAPGAEEHSTPARFRFRCCISIPGWKFREMIAFRDRIAAEIGSS